MKRSQDVQSKLMENGVTALTGIFFLLLCLAPASMDGLLAGGGGTVNPRNPTP